MATLLAYAFGVALAAGMILLYTTIAPQAIIPIAIGMLIGAGILLAGVAVYAIVRSAVRR